MDALDFSSDSEEEEAPKTQLPPAASATAAAVPQPWATTVGAAAANKKAAAAAETAGGGGGAASHVPLAAAASPPPPPNAGTDALAAAKQQPILVDEPEDSLRQTPIQNRYVFWFMHRGQSHSRAGGGGVKALDSFEQALIPVASFQTVEHFWRVYDHVARPGTMSSAGQTTYHVFKHGVKPTWEDPSNCRGGAWVVRLRKGLAARFWEELLLAVVGEQFDVGNEICGAKLSVRFSEDVLSLWNRNADNAEALHKIKDTMRRAMKLPPFISMEYKRHEVAMTGGGGDKGASAPLASSGHHPGGSMRLPPGAPPSSAAASSATGAWRGGSNAAAAAAGSGQSAAAASTAAAAAGPSPDMAGALAGVNPGAGHYHHHPAGGGGGGGGGFNELGGGGGGGRWGLPRGGGSGGVGREWGGAGNKASTERGDRDLNAKWR